MNIEHDLYSIDCNLFKMIYPHLDVMKEEFVQTFCTSPDIDLAIKIKKIMDKNNMILAVSLHENKQLMNRAVLFKEGEKIEDIDFNKKTEVA